MSQENTLIKPVNDDVTPKTSLMKSAVIVAPRKIEIVSVPIPEPSDDEVLIKLEGCGIGASDLPLWEGREWFSYPLTPGAPGHEGFGVVDKIGANVKDLKISDRVTMLSYHAYAEYDTAKASEVVKLQAYNLDFPFPGEPLGCAMNIFKRAEISRKDVVAVIGAGFIGNLLIQLSKATGAKVIAISQRDISLQLAFESGADHVIKLNNHYEIIAKINELTNNQACTRVIEATGKQWPLDLAGDIVGIRGKIIIAGYHQDGLRQINVQNWNWKGIDVINAHELDPQQYIRGMKDALFAIENHILNPELLYTHKLPLEDLDHAFKLLESRNQNVLKLIITC